MQSQPALDLLNFTQPPLEKSALALICNQRQRPAVALRRFRRGSGATQQVGARGMQQMIAVEIACDRVNQRERHLRAVNHCDRHGPVQRHDRRWLQVIEQVVEA